MKGGGGGGGGKGGKGGEGGKEEVKGGGGGESDLLCWNYSLHCIFVIRTGSIHTLTKHPPPTQTYLSRVARSGVGLAICAASLDNLIMSQRACDAFPHC